MSNAAAPYAAEVSDDDIEEFDSDDDGSSSEFVKSSVIENAVYNPPVRPVKAVNLQSNKIQFRGKNTEKKITINIKTPLIIEDKKIEPVPADVRPEEKRIEKDNKGEKKVEEAEGEEEEEKEKEEEEEEQEEEEEEEENDPAKKKNDADIAPDYAKHLSYEGSRCIYTEPGTGRQLIWNTEQNAWVSRCESNSSQVSGNSDNSAQSQKLDTEIDGSETSKEKKDPEAIGERSVENLCETKGPEAAVPGGVYGFEGDTHTYTDPNDGSIYMWDKEKNAWFPKVDDEFLARYQMSYGFTDPSAAKTEPSIQPVKVETKAEKEQRKAEAKRKAQEPSTWFEVDEAHNTAVYITGLPLDITMEELTEIVTKFGLLARDDKAKDKIKLYRDKDGQPKGDALVTYIKVESVNLALHLLDGSQIRGNTLSVQRAKFQMKGTYDPALKPKRKKKDKERAKKIHEKLFDWRPEPMRGEPLKCERIVIIKNLFSPGDFDKDVTLLLEYQQDLRAECSKCGEVKKVVLYDRHPEGVAQVTFKEPAEAQACISLLNGRWFAQKQISAEIWDGKTKYKIAETEAEIEERIAKWDKFLEDEDEKKEAAKKKAVEDCSSEAMQKTV